jgi:hypothetical protein
MLGGGERRTALETAMSDKGSDGAGVGVRATDDAAVLAAFESPEGMDGWELDGGVWTRTHESGMRLEVYPPPSRNRTTNPCSWQVRDPQTGRVLGWNVAWGDGTVMGSRAACCQACQPRRVGSDGVGRVA